MLEIKNLTKNFEQLRAVSAASLAVPRGKIVGLIGPNGSGKSTLFNLIAGANQVDVGQILFDSQDITHASPDHIFKLGLVRSYQDPQLFFRMNTLDNAMLPIKDQLGERVQTAPWHRRWREQERTLAHNATGTLQQILLADHASALAANLSGGQMKLLELARSLNGAPKLLLLDEPTAGVAPKLAREIFDRIAQLRRELGMTIFVIEHRLEVLFDYADDIYVMHLGQVIAHGSPADIAANAQVKEIYFGD